MILSELPISEDHEENVQELLESVGAVFQEQSGDFHSFVLMIAGRERAGFFYIEEREDKFLLRLRLLLPPNLLGKRRRRRMNEALRTPAFRDRPLAGRVAMLCGHEYWHFDAPLPSSADALQEIIQDALEYADEDIDRLDVVYGLVCEGESVRNIGQMVDTITTPLGNA
jgi:hypothetical protein